MASPNVDAAIINTLLGVSCSSDSQCFAVGRSAANNAPDTTLIERWNGTAWSIVDSANPNPESADDLFRSVSCPTDTYCVAVGTSESNATGSNPLITSWNGSTWSAAANPPDPGNLGTGLAGVSCTSAANCVAVGVSEAGTQVDAWDGTAWTIAAPPTGSSQNELTGVSCPSSTLCFAVGSAIATTGQTMLIERWNGSTWSTVPNITPPSGATASYLDGVSCPATTSCFAVGYSVTNAIFDTLIEHWNGTDWSPSASPNPDSAFNELRGVACTTALNCIAVGNTGSKTLAEHWNGSTWAHTPTLDPFGSTSSELTAIACSSSTQCFAVGETNDFGSEALIERWTGTTWMGGSVGMPALTAVSCSTTASCLAVGDTNSGTGFATFAAHWNGSYWKALTSPTRAGTTGSYLNGTTCNATTCFAVGYTTSASGPRTLVESWTATTGTIAATPNPTNASDLTLSSIACATATRCFAVGSYLTATGNYTLIEQYS